MTQGVSPPQERNGERGRAGRASLADLLPYGDANAIVVDMAREVLPIVRETPVRAGVCGTDPLRLMPVFLRELRAMGFDASRTFRPSASSTVSSARTSRRLAWATTSRWR
jgi:predicted TIM-barrel enzyme